MSRVSDTIDDLAAAMVEASEPGGLLCHDMRLSPGGQTKGGGSQHWNTPRWIVHMATEVLGAVDLDPFSNPASITGATVQWYGPDAGSSDGFVDSWAAVGRTVFFNPPWSHSGKAVRKAVKEYADGCEIVGLIPCSMNAKHWPLVEQAPARCYLNKRPSFLENGEEKKGNPKDVALVYWGPRPYRFADAFCDVGRIHFGRLGQ